MRMSRHKLTPEEQLEGIRAALASRRLPKHFRPALERRRKELSAQIEAKRKAEREHRRKRSKGFLDWFFS